MNCGAGGDGAWTIIAFSPTNTLRRNAWITAAAAWAMVVRQPPPPRTLPPRFTVEHTIANYTPALRCGDKMRALTATSASRLARRHLNYLVWKDLKQLCCLGKEVGQREADNIPLHVSSILPACQLPLSVLMPLPPCRHFHLLNTPQHRQHLLPKLLRDISLYLPTTTYY